MFDGMVDLLESVWEVRRFGYVRTGEEPAYYKMQVWGLLAAELDVAVLLDTDVVVRDSMDSIFDLVCAEAAGVRWSKGHASGINGGVVVLKFSSLTCCSLMYARLQGYIYIYIYIWASLPWAQRHGSRVGLQIQLSDLSGAIGCSGIFFARGNGSNWLRG